MIKKAFRFFFRKCDGRSACVASFFFSICSDGFVNASTHHEMHNPHGLLLPLPVEPSVKLLVVFQVPHQAEPHQHTASFLHIKPMASRLAGEPVASVSRPDSMPPRPSLPCPVPQRRGRLFGAVRGHAGSCTATSTFSLGLSSIMSSRAFDFSVMDMLAFSMLVIHSPVAYLQELLNQL